MSQRQAARDLLASWINDTRASGFPTLAWSVDDGSLTGTGPLTALTDWWAPYLGINLLPDGTGSQTYTPNGPTGPEVRVTLARG